MKVDHKQFKQMVLWICSTIEPQMDSLSREEQKELYNDIRKKSWSFLIKQYNRNSSKHSKSIEGQ